MGLMSHLLFCPKRDENDGNFMLCKPKARSSIHVLIFVQLWINLWTVWKTIVYWRLHPG